MSVCSIGYVDFDLNTFEIAKWSLYFHYKLAYMGSFHLLGKFAILKNSYYILIHVWGRSSLHRYQMLFNKNVTIYSTNKKLAGAQRINRRFAHRSTGCCSMDQKNNVHSRTGSMALQFLLNEYCDF